jgi:hypothetical protein
MSEKTLLPSAHADGAKVLLEKIRALRDEVPRYITPPALNARGLSALLSVPDAAIEAAGVMVERFERLATAANTDGKSLRDSYAYSLSYEAIIQELHALMRAVWYSVRIERVEAAKRARNVYKHARLISKEKDGAELLPYVEDMRKKLLQKRSRKTTSNPVPAPEVTAAPSAKV